MSAAPVAGGAGAAIAFDGVNIWVLGNNNVTKLLASTGSTVGTYKVGDGPSTGIAFDGTTYFVARIRSNPDQNYYSPSQILKFNSSGTYLGLITLTGSYDVEDISVDSALGTTSWAGEHSLALGQYCLPGRRQPDAIPVAVE